MHCLSNRCKYSVNGMKIKDMIELINNGFFSVGEHFEDARNRDRDTAPGCYHKGYKVS